MLDPVLDPGDQLGRCVEREAFEAFQQTQGARPLTGLPPLNTVRTYTSLKSHIEGFLEENGRTEEVKVRPSKRARVISQAAGAPLQESEPHSGGPAPTPVPLPHGILDIKADEVPASYFCPLSRRLMWDPVVDRNDPRVTWERSAVEEYVREHGANPLTGCAMELSDLLPARNMRSVIGLWLRKNATVQAGTAAGSGGGGGRAASRQQRHAQEPAAQQHQLQPMLLQPRYPGNTSSSRPPPPQPPPRQPQQHQQPQPQQRQQQQEPSLLPPQLQQHQLRPPEQQAYTQQQPPPRLPSPPPFQQQQLPSLPQQQPLQQQEPPLPPPQRPQEPPLPQQPQPHQATSPPQPPPELPPLQQHGAEQQPQAPLAIQPCASPQEQTQTRRQQPGHSSRAGSAAGGQDAALAPVARNSEAAESVGGAAPGPSGASATLLPAPDALANGPPAAAAVASAAVAGSSEGLTHVSAGTWALEELPPPVEAPGQPGTAGCNTAEDAADGRAGSPAGTRASVAGSGAAADSASVPAAVDAAAARSATLQAATDAPNAAGTAPGMAGGTAAQLDLSPRSAGAAAQTAATGEHSRVGVKAEPLQQQDAAAEPCQSAAPRRPHPQLPRFAPVATVDGTVAAAAGAEVAPAALLAAEAGRGPPAEPPAASAPAHAAVPAAVAAQSAEVPSSSASPALQPQAAVQPSGTPPGSGWHPLRLPASRAPAATAATAAAGARRPGTASGRGSDVHGRMGVMPLSSGATGGSGYGGGAGAGAGPGPSQPRGGPTARAAAPGLLREGDAAAGDAAHLPGGDAHVTQTHGAAGAAGQSRPQFPQAVELYHRVLASLVAGRIVSPPAALQLARALQLRAGAAAAAAGGAAAPGVRDASQATGQAGAAEAAPQQAQQAHAQQPQQPGSQMQSVQAEQQVQPVQVAPPAVKHEPSAHAGAAGGALCAEARRGGVAGGAGTSAGSVAAKPLANPSRHGAPGGARQPCGTVPTGGAPQAMRRSSGANSVGDRGAGASAAGAGSGAAGAAAAVTRPPTNGPAAEVPAAAPDVVFLLSSDDEDADLGEETENVPAAPGGQLAPPAQGQPGPQQEARREEAPREEAPQQEARQQQVHSQPSQADDPDSIDSVHALQAWLDRRAEQSRAASASAAAGASTSAAAPDAGAGDAEAVLDLSGRTLTAPPHQPPAPSGSGGGSGSGTGGGVGVVLRVRSRVVLRNGTLDGCCILVEGGSASLRSLTLRGSPRARPGGSGKEQRKHGLQAQGPQLLAVVAAQGAGSTVSLENCSVAVAAGASDRAGCVLAAGGGQAYLDRCQLGGAPCFGLAACGPDSRAMADRTAARHNGTAGFLAVAGGQVVPCRCRAESNGETEPAAAAAAGAAGLGPSSGPVRGAAAALHKAMWLRAADDMWYRGCGFAAVDGGSMVLGIQCTASRNKRDGYFAYGAGASLTTAEGCVAVSNERAGFWADKGASLAAGLRCIARGNAGGGFLACGHGARLRAGAGCSASGNGEAGFAARGGAALTAAEDCAAERNDGPGFLAAARHSSVSAAACCRAKWNGRDGFRAEDDGSLQAGQGCQAACNKGSGFASADGGQLQAQSGCAASRNEQHGFSCVGYTSSVLRVGPQCQAAHHAAGAGFHACGRGAVMHLEQGWGAEHNARGEMGEEKGGRICAPKA